MTTVRLSRGLLSLMLELLAVDIATDALLFRGEQFFRMTLCFGVATLTTGSILAEMK